MSGFILTDAAIEGALAPGSDVVAPADLTDRVARAVAYTTRRPSLWLLSPFAWPRLAPRLTQLLLVVLLLLMLAVVAIGAASTVRRALSNGEVIVASGAELLAIDPGTGASRSLLTGNGRVFGVSRSDDGRFIAFWTDTGSGTTLEVTDRTGSERRRLAANVIPRPVGLGQIDVWSPDRRSLAAGVLVAGQSRILVVDIASGNGRVVGPRGAANPLWSPDGRLLAFSYPNPTASRNVLAVMRPDGSGVRDISRDLGELNVSGANNWSPDGAWVYFGAERGGYAESHIYRANVEAGYSEQLTFDIVSAAPALSPDGTTIAYSNWPGGRGTQNLMLMDAAGANQRLLLDSTINLGWSNDGKFVLGEWRPPGKAFELLVLRPDGTDRLALMTFQGGCSSLCVDSVAWGQPRP